MTDPFLAEIRMFPFGTAPQGWMWCDGQLMSIAQNTALFSLLGTTYGGNGQSTFALPDLRGRVPMHAGDGAGLSVRDLGEIGGSASVTLLESHLPQHSHTMGAQNIPLGGSTSPAGNTLNRPASGSLFSNAASPVLMAASTLAPSGSDQPHNNLMPYLTLNFAIAVQGELPERWDDEEEK